MFFIDPKLPDFRHLGPCVTGKRTERFALLIKDFESKTLAIVMPRGVTVVAV